MCSEEMRFYEDRCVCVFEDFLKFAFVLDDRAVIYLKKIEIRRK